MADTKTTRAAEALASYVIPALALLPAKMNTAPAQKLLLAIGLQESDFIYTTQMGGGPARGYWQFEKVAVTDVLTRAATKSDAERVCGHFLLAANANLVYSTLASNHILAAAFARLNLYNDPQALPQTESAGWDTYLRVWKPGMPRPAEWSANYSAAAAALRSDKPIQKCLRAFIGFLLYSLSVLLVQFIFQFILTGEIV